MFIMNRPKEIFLLAFIILLLVPVVGHAGQTIDIANIFPEQILDTEVIDSKQGRDPQGKGYGYTKVYGAPGQKSTDYGNISISLIELSRQILQRDRYGEFTENKWRQMMQKAISKAPPGTDSAEINKYYRLISSGGWSGEEKQADGFRVVVEANDPGVRLVGFFRFYKYMCFVDGSGSRFGTYEYFDEAFRLVLERLGWLKE